MQLIQNLVAYNTAADGITLVCSECPAVLNTSEQSLVKPKTLRRPLDSAKAEKAQWRKMEN